MKLKLLLVSLIASVSLISSCTENARAKSYGGTQNIDLPAGQKLVTATWKDTELWYLTRPFAEGESPVTSTLHEKSNLGIVEGSVIFKESK